MNITLSRLKNKGNIFWLVIVSTILGISSSSWVILWVFIELNSLVMCGIITKELKKDIENVKPTILYLIIQLTSSIIFLVSVSTVNERKTLTIISILCLIIKSGAFPLHLWYLKTIQSLKIKTRRIKTLITWQKLLPFIIIPYFNTLILVLTVRLITLVVPIYKIKKTSSIKSILILSSINNNGWFFIAVIISFVRYLYYFFIYSISLIITINFIENIKIKRFNIKKKTSEAVIVIINMRRIPPSFIFIGKVVIILTMVELNFPKEIIVVIIIIRCYFIYHYLWSSYTLVINTPFKPQHSSLRIKSSLKEAPLLIIIITLTILIFLLGLTFNGVYLDRVK